MSLHPFNVLMQKKADSMKGATTVTAKDITQESAALAGETVTQDPDLLGTIATGTGQILAIVEMTGVDHHLGIGVLVEKGVETDATIVDLAHPWSETVEMNEIGVLQWEDLMTTIVVSWVVFNQ